MPAAAFDLHLRKYRPRTARAYRYWCNRAAAGGVDLDAPDPHRLAAWLDTLPPTRGTRQAVRAALRAYWQAVGVDPLPIHLPPKPRPRNRALDPDDARRLYDLAHDWSGPKGAVLLLGLRLGLRRSEIAELRSQDVGPRDLVLEGKGGHWAELPMPADVWAMLQTFQWGRTYVFFGNNGGHIAGSTINRWVAQAGEVLGLHLTPHMLRHTAITEVNDGAGLRIASEFARHRDPATTMHYTRVTRKQLVDALPDYT